MILITWLLNGITCARITKMWNWKNGNQGSNLLFRDSGKLEFSFGKRVIRSGLKWLVSSFSHINKVLMFYFVSQHPSWSYRRSWQIVSQLFTMSFRKTNQFFLRVKKSRGNIFPDLTLVAATFVWFIIDYARKNTFSIIVITTPPSGFF